jgi:hypothetical protein
LSDRLGRQRGEATVVVGSTLRGLDVKLKVTSNGGTDEVGQHTAHKLVWATQGIVVGSGVTAKSPWS